MCMCDKEENDMTVTENVKIDVKKSLAKSLQEVEDIRKGKLPKRSYKEMISRVKKEIDEDR